MKITFTSLTILLSQITFNTLAGDYEDYINGVTEIGTYLQEHKSTHAFVGPVNTASVYYSHSLSGENSYDEGFFFKSPLGNIADNESQFLSFEINTNTLFSGYSGDAMHLVISMRGNSFVKTNSNHEILSLNDVQLSGKGPILHHTEGRIDGCFGVGIEDFSINRGAGNTGNQPIPLCESYNSLKFSIQDNTKYRIDVLASKRYVAYWIFERNTSFASVNWSLQATSGSVAPEQHIDSLGNDSILIGTAGKRQINSNHAKLLNFTKVNSSKELIRARLNINNVYIVKWDNL